MTTTNSVTKKSLAQTDVEFVFTEGQKRKMYTRIKGIYIEQKEKKMLNALNSRKDYKICFSLS